MTKLIGGNISDTPIKDIGDGSAFSAGGGAAQDTAFADTLGNTDNLEFAFLPGHLPSGGADAGISNAVASPASGVHRNDYFLISGDISGTSTTRPTFNGTAGDASVSEYYGFDGGDMLHIRTPTTFIKSLAKNSADFTLLAAVYPTSAANNAIIVSTESGAGLNGIIWRWEPGPIARLRVKNASGNALDVTTTETINLNAWNVIGVSVDEAATTGHFIVNGVVESFTSTYSSPTTSDPTVLRVASLTDSVSQAFDNGDRLGELVAWNAGIGSAGLITASSALESLRGI